VGQRVFDVTIENEGEVISDLDLYALVGKNAAHDEVAIPVTVSDGVLGITIEDGRLYVTTKQILEFYRNHFKDSPRGESLTAKSIGHVLRNLAEIDRVTAMELESRPAIGRTRWHQLNAEDIHAAAQRDGWNCVVLDKLIEERERRKEGEHIESPVEV